MTHTTPRRPRSPALAALLLLGALLPAACSDVPSGEPQVQAVAYCPGGNLVDPPEDGVVDVEFRKGAEVVAEDDVALGSVFRAEVPLGDITIYADGREVGSVGSGEGGYASPAPDEQTYLSSEGCPEDPSA